MRITGGVFRGRALVSPSDHRVRPTSDKVRQAIFNVLAHHDFGRSFAIEGARVIDLFAGTGALGFESLSRGSVFTLFVEESAESRGLIRRNAEALALTGRCKIFRRDATDLGALTPGAGGPFSLAFLDPPYGQGLAGQALASLVDGHWLTPEAIVVIETAKNETAANSGGSETLDERVYGDTRVTFVGSRSTSV